MKIWIVYQNKKRRHTFSWINESFADPATIPKGFQRSINCNHPSILYVKHNFISTEYTTGTYLSEGYPIPCAVPCLTSGYTPVNSLMQTLYLFFIVNILHFFTEIALLFSYTNTLPSLYCKHLQFSTANILLFPYTNDQPSLYCKHLHFSTANILLFSYTNNHPSIYCKHFQLHVSTANTLLFFLQTLNQVSTENTFNSLLQTPFYFHIQTLNQVSTTNTFNYLLQHPSIFLYKW